MGRLGEILGKARPAMPLRTGVDAWTVYSKTNHARSLSISTHVSPRSYKIMITSSDRKLHVCYASAGTGARGAVHGLCALAIAVSAYVRATAMQSHVVVA